MQFIRDWILSTAAEVGLLGEVHEALHGVTIDILPSSSVHDDGALAQVFIPYYNNEGVILLRNLIESEIPKVIPVNWYEVGLTSEDGALVIKTYEGGGFFARGTRSKEHHFEVVITANGCRATGLWPQKVDEEVITVEDIEQIVPLSESSSTAFEIFISGTLTSEPGKKHRQVCAQSVAEHFPTYIPVSLNNIHGFDPNLSFERIENCDAFIIIITDYFTAWMENEYRAAKKRQKPILILVNAGLLNDSFHLSHIAELRPDAITSYEDDNLKEVVSRWLERIRPIVLAKRASVSTSQDHQENVIPFPEVIDLGLPEKEWIRVALGQIDYEISEQKPFALVDEKKTQQRVQNVIRIGRECKADFIVLPELSGTEKTGQGEEDGDSHYDAGVLISGSSFRGGWNIAEVRLAGNNYLVRKCHRSKFEDSPIAEKVMMEARPLRIFQTQTGVFSLLICEDFRHDGRLVAPLVDLLVVQSYNPAPENFRVRASVLVEDYHCYVTIVNASKFGSTALYGVIDRRYHSDLERAGYKDPSGPPCEIARIPQGHEGVLIADLSLKQTAVTVPTPVLGEYANIRNVRIVELD